MNNMSPIKWNIPDLTAWTHNHINVRYRMAMSNNKLNKY